jgi:hypothetical protein
MSNIRDDPEAPSPLTFSSKVIKTLFILSDRKINNVIIAMKTVKNAKYASKDLNELCFLANMNSVKGINDIIEPNQNEELELTMNTDSPMAR